MYSSKCFSSSTSARVVAELGVLAGLEEPPVVGFEATNDRPARPA